MPSSARRGIPAFAREASRWVHELNPDNPRTMPRRPGTACGTLLAPETVPVKPTSGTTFDTDIINLWVAERKVFAKG
jgi:hypothetical protein